MGYSLRQLTEESKFCQQLHLDALHGVLPSGTIDEVLQETGAKTQRERKLNLRVVVLWLIALHLFPELPGGEVFARLAQGLRYLWHDPDLDLPGASALCHRRYQLGVRPLWALFHRVCRPMTTQSTPGAFRFGLRLMAIDGALEDVPDTPPNAKAFGRPTTDRGEGAFPQVRAVYLCECGSHALVDAGFWPYCTSERTLAFRLLRSVGPGMLVMLDRGFYGHPMILALLRTGAHALVRLPAGATPERIQTLDDGSYLAYIYPHEGKHRRERRLMVRIIQYTISDPTHPGAGQIYRLATTLLCPKEAPALEVACAYHERWEVELVIDETQTHQRHPHPLLRSRKPEGVLQELYALMIAHYAVRFVMHDAALQTGLDPDRVSFVGALRLLTRSILEFQLAPTQQWEALYQRLLRDLVRYLLPKRRNRSNPRVVKRKMSNFKLKREEHRHWPQPTRSFREALALI